MLLILSVLLWTMQNKSFLQARCEEPIMTSDWGVILLLALLLLALLYTFLYLPATAQRALLEQALSSSNTSTTPSTSTTAREDWPSRSGQADMWQSVTEEMTMSNNSSCPVLHRGADNSSIKIKFFNRFFSCQYPTIQENVISSSCYRLLGI